MSALRTALLEKKVPFLIVFLITHRYTAYQGVPPPGNQYSHTTSQIGKFYILSKYLPSYLTKYIKVVHFVPVTIVNMKNCQIISEYCRGLLITAHSCMYTPARVIVLHLRVLREYYVSITCVRQIKRIYA